MSSSLVSAASIAKPQTQASKAFRVGRGLGSGYWGLGLEPLGWVQVTLPRTPLPKTEHPLIWEFWTFFIAGINITWV